MSCLDGGVEDPNLIVGTAHPDDAAVYRMPGGDLLVQTVDLIAPIVNDPTSFGRIACANSLSDVYAMGGRPVTALNIACFPNSIEVSVLAKILRGSIELLREAGCLLVGGHTLADEELKFGFSVSGVIEGGEILSIDRAQTGNVLVLTKPLGTGVINNAVRKGAIDDRSAPYLAAERSMQALNAPGVRAARAGGATAMTDITGFGFLGHAAQFARASGVSFEIERDAVPGFEAVRELLRDGFSPKRATDNLLAYERRVAGLGPSKDGGLLFDPQTSGGLLVALPEAGLPAFMAAMKDWPFGVARVGRVVPASDHDIKLV